MAGRAKAKVGRGEVRGSCRTRQDAKARLEKKFGGVVTNPDPRTWAVSERSEVRESWSSARSVVKSKCLVEGARLILTQPPTVLLLAVSQQSED